MKIVWFSEIKWGYLKTRKQQILSCFTDHDTIYFIEPVSKKIANRFTLQDHNPVYSITLPQLRSVQSPLFNRILKISAVRKIISIISEAYFRVFRLIHRIKPDIVITSNVYWADSLRSMKSKNSRLRIVYDCNDNPMAFPYTPDFKRDYFLKTVSIVDIITIPHSSYKDIIPFDQQKKIKIISNGVDYDAFQANNKIPDAMIEIEHPIIMYVGAVSDWFDFELVEQTAQTLNDHQIVLIGPVSNDANQRLDKLLRLDNVMHIPPIPHDEIVNYVNHADLCIIPFVKNNLTATVLPNKLFEYTAAGKTCIMTNFNESLREFEEFVHISESPEDFILKIEEGIKNPLDPKSLKRFASDYDWKKISGKFRKILESSIHDQQE